jgi:hypothetical protein
MIVIAVCNAKTPIGFSKPKQKVLVEAIIVQVSTHALEKLGIDRNIDHTSDVVVPLPVLLYVLADPNAANILARQKLLVSSGEIGKVQTKQKPKILTRGDEKRTADSTANVPIGTTMEAKPIIDSDGNIFLDLKFVHCVIAETNNIEPQQPFGINRPPITREVINTRLKLKPGRLVIAGRSVTTKGQRFVLVSAEVVSEKDPEAIKSSLPRACPNGHSTLKKVRIVYGTLSFESPEAEQRFEQAIKNYEVWPGGCVSGPHSPKFRLTCTTCGFGYDSEDSLWSRNSDDPSTFTRPFSKYTASFSKLPWEQIKGGPDYGQSVAQGRVVSESVSYTSLEPVGVLISRINDWFRIQGIRPRYSRRPHVRTITGAKRIISEWKSRRISVMLHHEEDGTSWVMLHVFRR